MVRIILFLFACYPIILFCQNTTKGVIVNNKDKLALEYCNVFNKTTQEGVITNTNGVYSLEVKTMEDTIVFSYVGYKTLITSVKNISQLDTICLTENPYNLSEIEIHSNNDFLIDIIIHCKNKIKDLNGAHSSKAFYILNTTTNNQPLEILEFYYSAIQKKGKLRELKLKNGRFALLPMDSRYFLNLNTSQAFNKIDLVKRSNFFPGIILQFNKREIRKYFHLDLTRYDSLSYYIAFISKSNTKELFNGELVINKKTYAIEKINLFAKSIITHPFIGLGGNITNIDSIRLEIDFVPYKIKIDKISLKMDLSFLSDHGDTIINGTPAKLDRKLNINSLLYFYDFNNPFIIPYFEYNNNLSDYRKLSIIPYNNAFWSSRKILLTNDQKKQIKIMEEQGYTLNYKESYYGRDFMNKELEIAPKIRKGFFEFPSHAFWNPKDRIQVRNDIKHKQIISNSNIPLNSRDLFNMDVQFLLDINPIGNQYSCKSFTILDLINSHYDLEIDEYTNAFLNIYFDLYEIERRKMMKELQNNNTSIEEINTIYFKSISNINSQIKKYLIEVQYGSNREMLKKWNSIVYEILGIDNFKLFQL